MAEEAQAVGIDLGTTYSSIAVWNNSQVKVIENEQGKTTTPSYVAFIDEHRLIGSAAKNQVLHCKNTINWNWKVIVASSFNLGCGKLQKHHF
jgi:molecular chaperone DnaK (HSP70)